MSFMLRDGWHCSFLEEDLKTPLRRRLCFRDDAKVRQMHQRFGESHLLEDLRLLEHALDMGRGGVWLRLSDDQYRALMT
jgi:hypothetical protein